MTQKVARITAAGSGMGAAIARKLAETGYKVGIPITRYGTVNEIAEIAAYITGQNIRVNGGITRVV